MGDALSAFRDEYWKDHKAGSIRTLEEYLRLFPGDARRIAREYLVNEEGSLTIGAGDGPAGDIDGEEGHRIGPYVTIKELGRGGQGVVYLAQDTRLDRKVALKVLSRLGPGSEGVLLRFKREAEVASRLEHPGICGIIDAAMDGNVPWIAMRFIAGRSFAQMIADSREGGETIGEQSIISFDDDEPEPADSPAQGAPSGANAPTRAEVLRVIKIFEAAARALHAAHEAGIVHRDVKPGNIIVDEDDQPVILDFGMAHDDVNEGPSLTQSGDLFGTPAYMSPEQLMAQRIALDRRTDVWSLGVTLYECLTLTRPFEAPTRQALYQTIMTKEATDPRDHNPWIPTDLRVVLDTALEKDRDRRYQTALELAEELRRIRCYEPIVARSAGPLLRLRRWSQRNPAVATLVVGVTLLLPVLSWIVSYSIGEAERAELASGKAVAESALREKVQAEAETLRIQAEDKAFRASLDDLGAQMGLLLFLFTGRAAHERQLSEYLGTFATYGLALDGSVTADELSQRVRAIHDRDERMGRIVLNQLYNFEWIIVEAKLTESKKPAHVRFRESAKRAAEVAAKAEWDPWYQRIGEASSACFDGDAKALRPFYRGPAGNALDASKLAWVGLLLVVLDQDRERADQLLARSLALEPDNFELRFASGGFAMEEYGRTRDPAFAKEALHHYEVANALHPESAITWATIAMVRGAVGQYRESFESIQKSIELAPDSALCWGLKGLLLGMGQRFADAEKALEKALQLDPSLLAAQRALDRVKQNKRPEIAPPTRGG
ncbi:MAG: hypothetical protein CMJ83_00130 [Planctomycetes bacterium]|nr:hypothetical protein [Planctomycetota bacterium]